ncbi:MAG: sodium:calcium antiporter, partial [Methanobrevibacter sp.]|nr:sodium:calcium antiporter [Methanobrevibacter sp.]
IGSNIFNILFVLGASSAISPIIINPNMLMDILLMLGVTLLCFIFAKTQDKYDKKEGIILVVLFITYMAFAILRN